MEIDILDRVRMIDNINHFSNIVGKKEKKISYNEHFDIFSFFHELPNGKIIEFDCDKYGKIYGSFGEKNNIKFYDEISYKEFPIMLWEDVLEHIIKKVPKI